MPSRLTWHGPKVREAIFTRYQRLLAAAAIIVTRRAKELLSIAGTGVAIARKSKDKGRKALKKLSRRHKKFAKRGAHYMNVEGRMVRVTTHRKTYYKNVGGKMTEHYSTTKRYHVQEGGKWKKIARPKKYYRRNDAGGRETHYGFS